MFCVCVDVASSPGPFEKSDFSNGPWDEASVDDVVRLGVEPWRGFNLAEVLKIEFFALSGRESSLVQTFCQSCVHLDLGNLAVHIFQRFVIQGCPTLNASHLYDLILEVLCTVMKSK